MQGKEVHSPLFKRIWKSAAMLRYKIFLWLLLHDRVNVRNLLARKHFHLPNYNCELCNCSCEETSLHLIWDCPFALQCWDSIVPSKVRGINAFDEINLLSIHLPKQFAMSIITMGCWHIWMQRNSKIFKAQNPSVQGWRKLLKDDLKLMILRTKEKHREAFSGWITDNLN